jgi:hypothetical protein
MQHGKDVPLGVRIDSSIAHFSRRTLYWLIMALLFTAGLASFAMIPFAVFEYGDGLHDISTHEWFFLALIALLLWRYWIHCSHFNVTVWTRLSRIFLFMGGFLFIEIAFYIASVIGSLNTGLSYDQALSDADVNFWGEVFSWVGVCLVLYLASPPDVRCDQTSEDEIPVIHAEASSTESQSKEQF